MKKVLYIFPLLVTLLFANCETELPETMGGIYGVVSNVENGEPVRGATVILSPGNQTTITGYDGRYEFSDLMAGQYNLQVSASGYNTNSRKITVVAGRNALGDMPLSPIVELMNVRLSSNYFEFGASYSELALTIQNTGNSGDIEWTITGIDAAWLKVSPTSGTVAMGKSCDVKLTVDRSKLAEEDTYTTFMVNAAGGSQSVRVNVSKSSSGNGNEDNNNDDNQQDEPAVQDVTNGLYAYYTFEDNTKNMVDGASNATAINSPTYVDGMDGTKGLKFSVSNNSYLSVPEPLIDRGTFSISFWVKGLGDGHIFNVPSTGNWGTSFDFIMKDGFLAYTTTGYTLAYRYDYIQKFSHGDINSNEWTMITLTSTISSGLGQSTVKLYLNGEFVDVISETDNVSYDAVGCGTKFIFGGKMEYYNINMNSSNMTIDNLRVYNSRVLSDSEVERIYHFEK